MKENFSNPEKKQESTGLKDKMLRVLKGTVLAAGLMSAPGAASAQKPAIEVRNKEYGNKNYETKDGNFRYYHNPKAGWFTEIGDEKTTYSLGATKSPFEDTDKMESQTRVPESLGETDFFTNYVNAAFSTDTVLIDKNTGNRYYNFRERNPDIQGVPYEGEKHWNIQRFLIDPQYRFFHIQIQEARKNALYDMYKYFLYLEKGDREKAWKQANDFIVQKVDPIVESKYAKWANENYYSIGIGAYPPDTAYYNADLETLYGNNDHTDLPEEILQHNSDVITGKKKGKLYGAKEIEDILIDYNIVYRKKDAETAKKIARESITSVINKYKEQIDLYQKKPITEYKVLKVPHYPPGFESWPDDEKMIWINDPENKDLIGEVQNAFTEKDRQEILSYLSTFRFEESKDSKN